MNPDIVAAVDELVHRGVLEPRAAVPLRRVASGSLVSVFDELRVLLWVGVLLLTTGVGVLVQQRFDRIGPLAIAIVIGAAAFVCLAWAWRHAPVPSFTFDSVLLLGALLAASDLAFIEVKFTLLGSHWPWHLLLVAAAYAALAIRFDSATLFSLSLTSFAAWRGVSLAGIAAPWSVVADGDRLFVETLLCGVLFVALGKFLEAVRFKALFEPAAAWLGWMFIVGALAVRLAVDEGRSAVAFGLLGCGALLAWFAWDERRLGRYALGIAAAAIGIAGALFEILGVAHGDEPVFLATVVLLAAAVIVLVLRAHRAIRASA